MKKSKGWTLLCWLISNRSRLKPWKLECAFQVGTGDGQLWRAWLRGTRTARDLSQEKVVMVARQKGWLQDLSDRQIDEIATGSVSIGAVALAGRDPRLPTRLPLPPNDHIPRPNWATANRAAALLLKDQQNPTSKDAKSRLTDLNWSRAVQAVEEMHKTESEQSVRAKLTAAYLSQAYSENDVVS